MHPMYFSNYGVQAQASSWMIIGPIIMVLFWAGAIALIIMFVRHGRPHHWNRPEIPDTSLQILKDRFAKGEITKEQYEDMKKTLLS